MIRFSHEIDKLTKKLIKEYQNDIHAAYAAVHNNTIGSHPDKELIEVKKYLEYLLACEAMEEYGWIQTDEGGWRKLTDEEIFRPWYPREENKE